MIKINKNNMVVIKQPVHTILSVVVIGDEFPIKDTTHNSIDKLSEFSDVVFIFSDRLFKSQRKINKEKFSTLYQACAYIESSDNLMETLSKTLYYDSEIFAKHFGFLLMNSWDIEENIPKNDIMKILGSTIEKPIIKIDRYSNKDLYDIYEKKWLIDDIVCPVLEKNKLDNKNTCYTSSSNIIMCKRNLVKVLLDFWLNIENKNYIKSFSGDNIKDYLASVIKYLKLDYINKPIIDVKL